MLDKLEKAPVQDVSVTSSLGVSLYEVEGLSLHHMRLDLQRKAFKMRDDGVTITQKEADELNLKLREIIQVLEEEHDYDALCDYMVDFNSFVVSNPYYNTFSW